ncbi:tetratricopeptide repeat protein [Kitasatospora sp. NPDC093806]|uniref:tetratricopeptide repeat protein n=1 Tax=Kitasatospora sp. NPDC093806 TaxID=3155075 RepID=UPI00341C3AEA
MDAKRLVTLVADSRRGSGYLIGPRLVLTSAHVVGRPGAEVRLAPPGEPLRHTGVVVWCGRPDGPDDAALVRVEDEPWPALPGAPVRWGRLVTARPGQPAETWGVPRVAQDPQQPGARPAPREFRQIGATVNPGTGIVGRRHRLDLREHPPEWRERGTLPWGGLSGAPMFCGDLLTGVLYGESAHSGHAALDAVPASVLFEQDGFRAALAEHGVAAVLEPVEFQELTKRAGPGAAGAPSSPAALLQAGRQVVDFHGRAELVASLVDWCAEPGPGVRLLHGPGGQGKTRLAHHLSALLTDRPNGDEPWVVLWPPEHAEAGQLTAVRDAAAPLLVVLDYAETRAAQLSALLEAAVRHHGATPFKLLLLARAAGEWWSGAPLAPGADEAVQDLLDEAWVEALPPLEADPAARPEAYRRAAAAFAAALPRVRGRQAHDWPALLAGLTPPALTGAGLGNALTLHMIALADLLDAAARASRNEASRNGAPGRDAEDRLLRHESGYWRSASGANGLSSAVSWETLTDAMAAAVLLSTEEQPSGDALLRRVPALADQTYDRRRHVRRWIESLYPPSDDGPWGTLQPDRLAERFVGRHLLADPGFAPALLRGGDPGDGTDRPPLSPAQAARFLTLLTRAAAHPPLLGRLDGQIARLCADFLPLLGGAAVEVATQVEEPAPLLGALRALTADPATPLPELAALADRLPMSSYNLAPWAVELSERLVADHRERHTGATGDKADGTAFRPVVFAGRLREYALRLVNLGRHEEALRPLGEVVALLEAPAATGSAVARSGLAATRNDLAVCLNALGRRQEALAPAVDAVARYRALVRSGSVPGLTDVRLRSHLVSSLNTLASVQGDLGRTEEARATMTEAVGLRRALAAETADEELLAALASNLNNLSLWCRALGRLEEALAAADEAVRILEPLAEANPDAYLESLALTLGTQSNCLGDMDRPEPAMAAIERSVTVRRRLARARPEVYEADLASSLNSLAIALGEFGRYAAAAAAIHESVGLYRKLVDAQPDAYRHELAMSLNTLANHLSDVADYGGALAAAREAAEIYGALARELPEAFAADAAMSLLTLAGRLGENGRFGEAVEVVEQAIGRYRQLAEARPEAATPGLATGLNNLAGYLRSLGRLAESIAAVSEAVDLVAQLAAGNPDAFRPTLALHQAHRARCLHDLGRSAEAVTAMRQAVETSRQLALRSPAVHAEPLAQRLGVHSVLLNAVGAKEEALEVAREAIEVRRRLAQADPEPGPSSSEQRLSQSLEWAGHVLGALGRPAEAAAVTQEAAEMLRRLLARAGSPELRLALVASLGSLGIHLMQAGLRLEALAALEEATALMEELAPADRQRPAFLPSRLLFGLLLLGAGRPEEAVRAAGDAVADSETVVGAEPGYLPVLIGALTSHGTILGELDKHERALTTLDRAVELARPAVEAGADAGTAADRFSLALALQARGEVLSRLPDRTGEALRATEESVTLHLALAAENPAGYEAALAQALPGHGLRLAEAGLHEAAAATTEEAVDRYRALTGTDRTAHEVGLAEALCAFARARLLAGRRPPEALAAVEESLAVARALAVREPAVVARLLRLAEETRAGLLAG